MQHPHQQHSRAAHSNSHLVGAYSPAALAARPLLLRLVRPLLEGCASSHAHTGHAHKGKNQNTPNTPSVTLHAWDATQHEAGAEAAGSHVPITGAPAASPLGSDFVSSFADIAATGWGCVRAELGCVLAQTVNHIDTVNFNAIGIAAIHCATPVLVATPGPACVFFAVCCPPRTRYHGS